MDRCEQLQSDATGSGEKLLQDDALVDSEWVRCLEVVVGDRGGSGQSGREGEADDGGAVQSTSTQSTNSLNSSHTDNRLVGDGGGVLRQNFKAVVNGSDSIETTNQSGSATGSGFVPEGLANVHVVVAVWAGSSGIRVEGNGNSLVTLRDGQGDLELSVDVTGAGSNVRGNGRGGGGALASGGVGQARISLNQREEGHDDRNGDEELGHDLFWLV